MINLKNDQLFVYKSRSFPNRRNLNQIIFGRQIYPWSYHFTCNDLLKKDFEHRKLSLNSETFFEDMKVLLSPYEREMVLVSNPEYRCSWSSDGAHSDIWTTIDKGIDTKELNSIYQEFLSNKIPLRGNSLVGLGTLF